VFFVPSWLIIFFEFHHNDATNKTKSPRLSGTQGVPPFSTRRSIHRGLIG